MSYNFSLCKIGQCFSLQYIEKGKSHLLILVVNLLLHKVYILGENWLSYLEICNISVF